MEQVIFDKEMIENSTIEFKSAKKGLPSSLWETYSAFANSKGGIIYLGIAEIDTNTFVSSSLTIDEVNTLKTQLFSLANNPQKVNVNLLSDLCVCIKEYNGNPILEIKINPCPKEYKPVFIDGNILTGTYRRNFDGDYHCSPQEIKSMLRDSSSKALDLTTLNEYSLDDLCIDTINSYINRFSSMHPDHPFLKQSKEQFLEFIGAVRKGDDEKYHPTISGLLMFGYSYKILYEFPEYFLDYQEHYEDDADVRWSDRLTSDSGTWSGNLFDFYIKTVNKLTSDLKMPFQMKDITRYDETLMHKALREALCNAICNADFAFQKGIVIKKYKNYIEFKNPGCLKVSVEQAFKGGDSDARNKNIQKMFSLVGIGERIGSGIPLIVETAKNYNFKLPSLSDEYNPDRTTLTIYLYKEEKISKSKIEISNKSKKEFYKEQILSYLLNNDEAKAKDIANALKINVTTVKNCLYQLIKDEHVIALGLIKDRRYKIKTIK